MDGSPLLLIRQTAVWHSDAARGPSTPSLDHLVGAQQKRFGDRQPERLGGGQIEGEIELSRLLDRKVAWLRSAQNLVDIVGGAPVQVRLVWSIGHQTSRFDGLPGGVARRQSRGQRQGIDADAMRVHERVDTDIKCVCTVIERLEGGYDVFASLDFCCNDL